mmetsp:Transcript_13852/g.43445  ORF Transcript_13852/g.43445 Transcript_13852/m.43445 type:complete len:334 (-) Transcript_13852:475-1476(-)
MQGGKLAELHLAPGAAFDARAQVVTPARVDLLGVLTRHLLRDGDPRALAVIGHQRPHLRVVLRSEEAALEGAVVRRCIIVLVGFHAAARGGARARRLARRRGAPPGHIVLVLVLVRRLALARFLGGARGEALGRCALALPRRQQHWRPFGCRRQLAIGRGGGLHRLCGDGVRGLQGGREHRRRERKAVVEPRRLAQRVRQLTLRGAAGGVQGAGGALFAPRAGAVCLVLSAVQAARAPAGGRGGRAQHRRAAVGSPCGLEEAWWRLVARHGQRRHAEAEAAAAKAATGAHQSVHRAEARKGVGTVAVAHQHRGVARTAAEGARDVHSQCRCST